MEKLTWKFLLAESAVIIISILIAFGIQAWWEELQEDEESTRILEAVLREHRNNLDVIESWEQRELQSTDDWYRKIGSPEGPQLSREEFDEFLSHLSTYGMPLVSFRSLAPLIEGGRIAVIDDVVLRRLLTRLSDFSRAYAMWVDQEREFLDNQLGGYLAEHADRLQIQRSAPGDHLQALNSWQVGTTTDHRDLLRDAKFRNLLVKKYLLRQNYRSGNGRFMKLTAELDELLVDALGFDPDDATSSNPAGNSAR